MRAQRIRISPLAVSTCVCFYLELFFYPTTISISILSITFSEIELSVCQSQIDHVDCGLCLLLLFLFDVPCASFFHTVVLRTWKICFRLAKNFLFTILQKMDKIH